MKKALLTFIIVIIACQIAFASFGKHKYHTSFTRIDHNQQEKLLEVTIRVFSHDLLPTLNNKYGKNIDLENTKDIDQILQNYLRTNFLLKTKAGTLINFKWLGKELETDVIRFYIEFPFEGNLEGAEIKNTMFFESFREQINLVSIRYGEKKSDLIFKVGNNYKTITENKMK